jgi:Txe/YoeB family toxin of Txe-Axe toxin-antitoxin module
MLIENPILTKFSDGKNVTFSHLSEKLDNNVKNVLVIPFSIVQQFGTFRSSPTSLPETITSQTNSQLIQELRIGQHLVIATNPKYIDAKDESLSLPLSIFKEHALLYSLNDSISQSVPLKLNAPKHKDVSIWFNKQDYLTNKTKIKILKERIEMLLEKISNWDYRSITTLEPLLLELEEISANIFVTRDIINHRMDLETIRAVISPPSMTPISGMLPINKAIDIDGNGIYFGDHSFSPKKIKEHVPDLKSLPPVNHYLHRVFSGIEAMHYYTSEKHDLLVVFENGTIVKTNGNLTSHHSYMRNITQDLDYRKTLDIEHEYKYDSKKIIAILEIYPFKEIMQKEWLSSSISSYPQKVSSETHSMWVKDHISARERDNVLNKLIASYYTTAEEKLKLLEEKGYPESWLISPSKNPASTSEQDTKNHHLFLRNNPLHPKTIATTLFDFVECV